ncbi:protease [Paenibacillus sp. MMS18-CY102]|uniref:protease n=1 Tax=Paenibacillus sp. MMS18-CY102 TaxID=2682849 RepID=UPI001366675B|nr:protease [Paenibacillus sp. MMS18-CY102]MWC30294.1 protease [Paenibacillus sp. MMS18-CY102]
METLFLACLIGGVLYAIVSVLIGDWLGQMLDGALDFLSADGHPWLHSTAIVGGITVFGGAGLLLERYTMLSAISVLVAALLVAIVMGIAMFFLYIRPMEQSENSTAFSMKSLVGKAAEVLVPIPAAGCGEVLVKVGAGFTNQIAASYDGEPIAGGARVVIVEATNDTLLVSQVDLPLLSDETERGM